MCFCVTCLLRASSKTCVNLEGGITYPKDVLLILLLNGAIEGTGNPLHLHYCTRPLLSPGVTAADPYGYLSIMWWCPMFSTLHRLGDGPWVASQGTVLLVHKGRLSQVFPGAGTVPGGCALRRYQHKPYQNCPPQQALDQLLSPSQQTPNDLLGEFLFGTLHTFSYRLWVKATTGLPHRPLILNVWFSCFFLGWLWDSPMYLLACL